MSSVKTELKHVQLEKKMGEFYLALGALNKCAVEKILSTNDSDVFDKVIDGLLDAACEIHDQQCGDGFYYDHGVNACVKLRDVLPDNN